MSSTLSPDSLVLRPATAEDRLLLAEAALANDAHPDLDPVPDLGSALVSVASWPGDGDFGLVAMDEAGTLLGIAWLTGIHLGIHVFDGVRDQGVGTALLTALVSSARSRGLTELRLRAQLDDPARRFLIGFGFEPAGDGVLRLSLSDLEVVRSLEEDPRPRDAKVTVAAILLLIVGAIALCAVIFTVLRLLGHLFSDFIDSLV